jgi:hypothetical protein
MTRPSYALLPGGGDRHIDLPLVTVDLDGVLCRPPFGWNVTARGPVEPPDVPRTGRLDRVRGLAWRAEPFRYSGRRGMPGARPFLEALHPRFRLVLVTARGVPAAESTRRWLEQRGLLPYLDGLAFRADPHRPATYYKADAVAGLHAAWHVDDDGRTAMTVMRLSGVPVVVVAWPRNAGEYPAGVSRVASLGAAAQFLIVRAGQHDAGP